MAQPVPIHADKPQLLARRLELAIREVVPVERATLASCENQSFWIRDGWFTRRQNLNGLRPQRHRSLTAWSLGNIEVTIVDTLRHSQFAFLQIDVSPTQRQQLANPQPGQDQQPS